MSQDSTRLMPKMGIIMLFILSLTCPSAISRSIVPYLCAIVRVFPNQVWSIDITYIPYRMGICGLTAIITGIAGGWSTHYLSDSLEAESVIHAVTETVKACGVVLSISDHAASLPVMINRICFVTSISVKVWTAESWADNIMIERWFRSLKTEQLYRMNIAPRELRRLIEQYVDDYNNARPR